MSTAPLEASERISPRDLGKVPRKTAALICELVNEYGVRHRVAKDGNHVFLYTSADGSDRSDTRPYKVSPSRPDEHNLQYLYRWIDKNVPAYSKREEVTAADVTALAEAYNSKVEEKATKTAIAEKPPVTQGYPADAKPYLTSKGNGTGFVTDGTTYWCTKCEFAKDDKRGLHLHTLVHEQPEKMAETGKKGGTTRGLRVAQRKAMAQQAAGALAEYHGFVVYLKGEAPAKSEVKTIEKLEAKLAKVEKELADAKARLELITGALKA